jgi:hypothetical protein
MIFGRRDSPTRPAIFYSAWDYGEPNNSGNEDAAQAGRGEQSWNDVSLTNEHNMSGYFVEYSTPDGDANGDGRVSLDDFVILRTNFGAAFVRDEGYSHANFNGDRTVSIEDFVILKANFGADAMTAVPEPEMLTLAILGLVCIICGHSAKLVNSVHKHIGLLLLTGIFVPRQAVAQFEAPLRSDYTGHYYEHVAYGTDDDESWQAAIERAANHSHRGIPGHLVTIMNARENSFLYGNWRNNSGAWIAATDEDEEELWRWAAGPEAGIVFWSGTSLDGGPTGFETWGVGEPNGDIYENWAVWNGMHWIDLSAEGGEMVEGYFVEYSTPDGDANGDGRVGLDDFVLLRSNFGNAVVRNEGYSLGNFNADSLISVEDFVILKDNFGANATAPVPEPAGLALMVLGALGSIICLRNRRRPSMSS